MHSATSTNTSRASNILPSKRCSRQRRSEFLALLLQAILLLQGNVCFTQSFIAVTATSTPPFGQEASHSMSSSNNNNDATIISRCVCGRASVRMTLPNPTLPKSKKKSKRTTVTEEDMQAILRNSTTAQAAHVVECHCPACRKFHVAALGSFLQVPACQVELVEEEVASSTGFTTLTTDDSEDKSCWKIYQETCAELGAVERVMCRHCFSKMLTRPTEKKESKDLTEASSANTHSAEDPKDSDGRSIFVNMGGLVESTVPQLFRHSWRLPGPHRRVWQGPSRAVWMDARHKYPQNYPQEGFVSQGQCACGKCRYQFPHAPPELQHCYCRLCRQLSGSAFQTWIPVQKEDWQWSILQNENSQNDQNEAGNDGDTPASTSTSPLQLIRTTDHGQRHVCTNCGGVLTILYDEDRNGVWPAAGGLNDGCLPETTVKLNPHLFRVCHIGCIWKQSWYAIPNDGLERIQYAS